MSVTQDLIDIVKRQLENMGYELVDLKYGKHGKKWLLQIFADKDGGINIDDCQKISQQVSYELDRYPDLLKHAYNLEVSSPGIDRQLKTETAFIRNINKDVKINLYTPVDNYRRWSGKIIEAKNGRLVIEDKDGVKRTIDIDKITKANLEVKA